MPFSLSDRRERLGLPASLPAPTENADAREIPMTFDICDWFDYLVVPCDMPHRFEPQPRPTSDGGAGLLLVVGPDKPGESVNVRVAFDARGKWLSVALGGSQQRVGTQPPAAAHLAYLNPESGYTAGEAAHATAIFLESDAAGRTWRSYRSGLVPGSDPSATRIRRIARRRIADHVHRAALESVAADHPEEYEEHHEAQKVLRALSSDWYPDPTA